MHATATLDQTPTVAIYSADAVAEEAERILMGSPYRHLRRVRCSYHDGILTLHGHVPSFFLKQMAQSVVSRVDGVRRVNNEIKVP
jgi:osmotically-inducible protein OsmY